jgi:UDP-glucuronate decarboxylase
MVEGIIRMMNTPKGFTGPVNLGNPSEVSILELARLIIELVGSSSKMIFKPLPQDDPERRRPDISFAKEKLGWKPTVGLETGIRKTIEYFKGTVKTQEGKRGKVHFQIL